MNYLDSENTFVGSQYNNTDIQPWISGFYPSNDTIGAPPSGLDLPALAQR